MHSTSPAQPMHTHATDDVQIIVTPLNQPPEFTDDHLEVNKADVFDFESDPANQRFSRALLDHVMCTVAHNLSLLGSQDGRNLVVASLLHYFGADVGDAQFPDVTSLAIINDEKGAPAREQALKTHIRELKVASFNWTGDCTVSRNISMLQQVLRLKTVECKIIAMTYCALSEPLLCALLSRLSISHKILRSRQLAILLDEPIAEIKATAARGGRLASLGLLEGGTSDGETDLMAYFAASERLIELLTVPIGHVNDIMDRLAPPALPSAQADSDFSHWHEIASLMVRCIESRHRNNLRGTNILLFGAPGTGKTELAHHVARLANARLCAVKVHHDDGSDISSAKRLAEVLLLQAAFANTAESTLPVVLCDDADELFAFIQNGSTARQSTYSPDFSRAWMNSKLETNTVATIWIVNSLDAVELSYRRRFTLSFAINTVPRYKRRHMADQLAAAFQLSSNLRHALTERRSLLPYHFGQLTQLLSVPGNGERDVIQWLQRNAELFESSDASAIRSLSLSTDHRLPLYHSTAYDWNYATVDDAARAWLTPIVAREDDAAIAAFPMRASVLVCNADPQVAGCGKSALVTRVAAVLDKTLLTLTSEMLIGSTMGQSMPSISQYFAYAAAHDHAICLHHVDELFSESDQHNGLVRTPSMAHFESRWSASLIAELTAFDGIVFATVTHPSKLPERLLATFDHRVTIAPLRNEQVIELLRQYASDLPPGELPRETIVSVQALDHKVSIGEFKRALRRCIGIHTESRKHIPSTKMIESLSLAVGRYSSHRATYH